MANQFLIKNTMQEIKELSADEVDGLQDGVYTGVKLLGYYEKGDTPFPIHYYQSDTLEADDGGGIVHVGGITLEHKFVGRVNPRFYGASPDLIDNYQNLQICIDKNSDIEIDDIFKIVVSEIDFLPYKTSTSIVVKGDKRIDFTSKGCISYGIDVLQSYYPAFIILDNRDYKVIFNNPKFIYTGDFGQQAIDENNKWNLGLHSYHFSSHIFTYNSDVDINNFNCSGVTADNVINIGISVHHSRCRVNKGIFDDYCLGILATRKNFDIVQDYLIINDIAAGRQSQKSYLVYGPPHLIYMNGHANFQASNIVDSGVLSVYKGSSLTYEGQVFSPHFDGHTIKVVNGTGCVIVNGVNSNRMEGVLDIIGTSDRSLYDNIAWNIKDFVFGYYDWGAIRVDRGTSGVELPVKINADLKMEGGDRKFIDLRADLAEINLTIEQRPAGAVTKTLANASIVKNSKLNIVYKNDTEFQPPLIYIDRACVRNEFIFVIKGASPNSFGSIYFNVSGSQVPFSNLIKLKGPTCINVNKIIETGTLTPLSILKNNMIYVGEKGDKICFQWNSIVPSSSGLNLSWEVPFLPYYNNTIDRINITAVAPGDFYVFSQDFTIRKFGSNSTIYNTLSIEEGGWMINGTILNYNSGAGSEPPPGSFIYVGGVKAKVKSINISAGSFGTNDASGTIIVEHYNRIDNFNTSITGENMSAVLVTKTTSFYEGLSISNNVNGLIFNSKFNRTTARGYVVYLTVLDSHNYRP